MSAQSNSTRLYDRRRTALVVVDVQDGFRSYDSFSDVATAAGRLVEGAKILDVPIIATEQYPKGLQHTAAEVGLPDDATLVEKSVFSAVRAGARGYLVKGAEQEEIRIPISGPAPRGGGR